MSEMVRFGISMQKELLEMFDTQIVARGYANRSEAVRDLIRNRLVEQEWQDGSGEVAGSITLVYDHHTRGLNSLLTDLQHDYYDIIITSTHVHLDHDNCLEVLIIKGKADLVQAAAAKLTGLKGVKFGKLSLASTGKKLR